MMIKHMVMWNLQKKAKGRTAAENAKIIMERLKALNGRIPGMKMLEVGMDFSRSPMSFDMGLYSEFESRKALDDYQEHPEHAAVRDFIFEVIDGDIVLLDYEI